MPFMHPDSPSVASQRSSSPDEFLTFDVDLKKAIVK
jgi:hypothetical protein